MSEFYGQTNQCWELLFDKYDILHRIHQEGNYVITASQIKEFREPRLMAKFDHKVNLPQIFKEHSLSILPCTRGSYIISHFKTHHEIEQVNSPVTKVPFPVHLQSLEHTNVFSESIALNCAFAAGIVADFMEDEELVPTVSGRMSSGSFRFDIENVKQRSFINVEVVNSQIEIDGGYEGVNSLGLIEAKMDISDDFIVRQLYYPYRLLTHKITKQVKPIIMFYSNGIFRLYEYQFQSPSVYSSLVLVKQKNYTIDDTTITISDIKNLIERVKIVPEPKIPFPQADSFERVINLCELLVEAPLTRDEVTQLYDFDARQTNYYTDAGRYLGLIRKYTDNGEPSYELTAHGRFSVEGDFRKRKLFLSQKILEHGAFHKSMYLFINRGEMPNQEEIVDIMKNSEIYRVESESTFTRRASTIRSWLNWIIGNTTQI